MIYLLLLSIEIIGLNSLNYDIPSYYGHFNLNFFDPSHILDGKLVELEYHFAVDAHYDNQTIYFANSNLHCVYAYDRYTKIISVLIGQCGFAGDVSSNIKSTLFNSISSIAYFQTPTAELLNIIKSQKNMIVRDQICSINQEGCLIENASEANIKMQNIRISPEFNIYQIESNQKEFLYLADSANHCIKLLNLISKNIKIVAGQCGSQGFLDGPFGYNRLNYPTNLAISREGVVYFFDKGNKYIRIINLKGQVQTLLLGACKYKSKGRKIEGYQLYKMLCYETWMANETKAPVQHYFKPSILKICTEQASRCSF